MTAIFVSGARALGKGRAARLRGWWTGTYKVCGMRMVPRAPDGKELQWEETEGLSQEEVARVVAAPSTKTRQVVDAIAASDAVVFACTDIHYEWRAAGRWRRQQGDGGATDIPADERA